MNVALHLPAPKAYLLLLGTAIGVKSDPTGDALPRAIAVAVKTTAGTAPERADAWQVGVNWLGATPTGELWESGNLSAQLAQRTLMVNLPGMGGRITVRLRLGDNQPDVVQGRSAELPLTLSVMLAVLGAADGAHGRLLHELQPPFAATGLLHAQDGGVGAVQGMAAKLDAALAALADEPDARIFVPRANQPAIAAELWQRGADRIVLVDALQEALDVLKADVLALAQRQGRHVPEDVWRQLQALRAPLLGNPFRGLQPFDLEHRAQFFGRDAQIDEVLAHLPADAAVHRLPGVLISGFSGSGKSSLMKAGVLGRLLYSTPRGRHFRPRPQERDDPHGAVWRPPTLSTPTEADWTGSLARHLQHWFPAEVALPHDNLQALGQALAQRLSNEPDHWVLAIDQMEGLVSQTHEGDRERVDALLRQLDDCLAHLAGTGVWLLGTAREEYAGRLQGALRESFPRKVRLQVQQPEQFIVDVIDMPCRLAGMEYEPKLLDALRADAEKSTSVPLLQYALDKLYERAKARQDEAAAGSSTEPLKLRLVDYEDMGRLQGAINLEAQALLKEQPLQASRVLGLLGRMARKAQGSGTHDRRYVRAPLPVSVEEATLLERWIDRRLVVRWQDYLEVAHEAVLNHFTELREWLERHDALLQWRQGHLLPQMAQWEHLGQDAQWCLNERDMPSARKALQVAELLSGQEQEYVHVSEQELQRQQQQEAERERQRREEIEAKNAELDTAAAALNQRNRRLRIGAWVLASVAALAVAAGIWAYSTNKDLTQETRVSEQRARLARKETARAEAATAEAEKATETLKMSIRALEEAVYVKEAQTRLANERLINSKAMQFVAEDNGRGCGADDSQVLKWIWAARVTGDRHHTPPTLAKLQEADCIAWRQLVVQTDAWIRSLRFSADGRRILFSDYEGKLLLRNAYTGRSLNPEMEGQQGTLPIATLVGGIVDFRLTRSPLDTHLRLWDARTGRELPQPIRGDTGDAVSVDISTQGRGDGRLLAAGYRDGTLRLWNTLNGSAVGEPLQADEGPVNAVAFSPDGRMIVSTGHDLCLWDAETGQPLWKKVFSGRDESVTSVAFSPDGRWIVSGGRDGSLRLWDVQSGRPIGEPMRGHASAVDTVTFSPDSEGRRIVSGDAEGNLRVWDSHSRQLLGLPIPGPKQGVGHVAFSPDGHRLVSSYRDGTLHLWRLTDPSLTQPIHAHDHPVFSVAFSPDGGWIVSGGGDELRMWDAQTGQPRGGPMRGHRENIESVAFSPDGRRIVSGGMDGSLLIWDAVTGQPLDKPTFRRMGADRGAISSLAASRDGHRIVSVGSEETVELWNAHTGEPVGQPMSGHGSWVTSVAFAPDGRRMVSGDERGILRLWNAKTLMQVGGPLRGHDAIVGSVVFSPDGRRIVSGSYDKTLRLWDGKTGQPLGEPMRGHGGPVKSVAFSPDGRTVVSAGYDETLRLWDARTRAALGEPMNGHKGWVLSVAFSPDGRRIVSGGMDGTIRLWRPPHTVADELCKRIRRNPSPVEWQAWGLANVPDKPLPCPMFQRSQ